MVLAGELAIRLSLKEEGDLRCVGDIIDVIAQSDKEVEGRAVFRRCTSRVASEPLRLNVLRLRMMKSKIVRS